MGFEKPFSGLEKESSYLYGPFYVRPRVSWKVDACWVSICNWESHLKLLQKNSSLATNRAAQIHTFIFCTYTQKESQTKDCF